VLKSYFSGHRNVKMHTPPSPLPPPKSIGESTSCSDRELLKKMKDRGSGQQDATVQR